MPDKPIIFSGPMVRAILDGKKSQTRRVVKSHDEIHKSQEARLRKDGWWFYFDHPSGDRRQCWATQEQCPYGQPGDKLWVRETWKSDGCYTDNDDQYIEYRAGGRRFVKGIRYYLPDSRWRPSIHMPRWASRITLEITDVRVERVQDISEKDAHAEGFEYTDAYADGYAAGGYESVVTTKCYWRAREAFGELWDSLNAKRGYGREVNPWAWVIEFKRISQ